MSEVSPAAAEAAVQNVKDLARFEADFLAMIATSGLNRLSLAKLTAFPKRTIAWALRSPGSSATLEILMRTAWACGYRLEIKLVKVEQ